MEYELLMKFGPKINVFTFGYHATRVVLLDIFEDNHSIFEFHECLAPLMNGPESIAKKLFSTGQQNQRNQ